MLLRLLCLLACAAAQTNFTAHVVVACDAHQFQGLGAVLHSAAAAAGASAPRLAFTVVVPEADAATAARLAACAVGGSGASARVVAVERTGAARLQIPGYDDFAASSPEEAARQAAKRAKYGRLGSRLNYARFFLDELLPADAATALYVDVDAVVCENVDHLFEIDCDLAAAPDVFPPDRFNAGVLLLRPDRATYDRLVALAPTAPSYDGGDTGFLNAAFPAWHGGENARLARLPFACNAQRTMHWMTRAAPGYWEAVKPIKILHFSSAPKPWQAPDKKGECEMVWWDFFLQMQLCPV